MKKSFKSLLVRELQRELGYREIEYNSKDRKATLQEVRTSVNIPRGISYASLIVEADPCTVLSSTSCYNN